MNLNDLQQSVEQFTAMGPLRDLVRIAFDMMREGNRANYMAHLRTRRIPEQTCELDLGDDGDALEVLTGSFGEFITPTGELREVLTESQRQDLLEAWLEQECSARESLEEADIAAAAEGYPGWLVSAQGAARRRTDECVDIANQISRADWRPRELVGNTLRRYYADDIDQELAERCGLAVVRRSSDDSTWLGLTGAGQDLSAQFMAYQALRYGAVDEQYGRLFSEPRYWDGVIPSALASEVEKILGIQHCAVQIDRDAQKRKVAFGEAVQAHGTPPPISPDESTIKEQALAALRKALT